MPYHLASQGMPAVHVHSRPEAEHSWRGLSGTCVTSLLAANTRGLFRTRTGGRFRRHDGNDETNRSKRDANVGQIK